MKKRINRTVPKQIGILVAFFLSLTIGLPYFNPVAATPAALGCWYTQADMPTARRALAVAAHGGQIYVIGGRDDDIGNDRYDIVEQYNPATDSWATVAPMPTERAWLVAATVNDKIYAIGGSDVGGKLSTVEEYDPIANSWTTKTPMPTPRDDSVIGVVNDKIYVIGGWNVAALDVVEEYDPATDTWSTKSPIPEPIALAGGGVISDQIHVVGGFQDTVRQDHYSYDPATDSWSSLPDMPTGRSRVTAGVVGNELYVIGGYSPTLGWLDLVESYDPGTNLWTTMNAMPTRRGDLAGAEAGGQIYVFGGRRADAGPVLSTAESVDFACTDNPPDAPSNPDPGGGWTNRPWDTVLSWTASDPDPGDSLTYDVYFGPELIPPLVSGDQSSATYTPAELLDPYTWYYWRIVARDNEGAVTSGPRWSFKTGGPGNQIKNGGFETDLSFWELDTQGPAQAAFARDTINPGQGIASARINITTPGNLSGVQLTQDDLTQVSGITYIIAFRARASVGRPIEIVLRNTAVPGIEYYQVTPNITTTWQYYEFTFTAAAPDTNATLQFNLGQYTSSVWLDDIQLVDLPFMVTKTPGTTNLPEPGGTVTFNVVAFNNSAAAVALTSLVDDPYGDLTNPFNPAITNSTCFTGGILAANGGTFICSFQAQVSGEPGEYTDTITATAAEYEDTAAATVTITDVAPVIQTEVTVNQSTLPEPGGTVDFTVRIDNDSVETVNLTALVDNIFGNITNAANPNLESTTCQLVAIGQGGFYECSFQAQVLGEPGAINHQVTATAQDNEDNSDVAADNVNVTITDAAPTMTVNKSATPSSVPEPGSNVTFDIVVNNTSEELIRLTALVDSVYGELAGQGNCNLPQNIAANSSYGCAFNAAVSGNAGDQISSTVTATANDNENNTVEAVDSSTVDISDSLPVVTVNKTADPANVDLSGDVTFTVLVANQSGEPVTLMSLVDSAYGDLNGQGTCTTPQVIPAGNSYSCDFTVFIAGNVGDSIDSIVVATAVDDENNSVQAFDNAAVEITGHLIFLPVVIGDD